MHGADLDLADKMNDMEGKEDEDSENDEDGNEDEALMNMYADMLDDEKMDKSVRIKERMEHKKEESE